MQPSEAASAQMQQMVADLEIEMMSDMYRRYRDNVFFVL